MAANAPEPDVLERLIGFGRDLRGRGLPVGTGRIVTFCRAAGALGVLERDDLYWAGRSSLISRPEDVEAFDAAFDAWFGTGFRLQLPMPGSPPDVDGMGDDERALEGDDVDDRAMAREWHELEEDALTDGEASIRIVASAAEMLREKSFVDLTEEERVRVTRLIRKLALQQHMIVVGSGDVACTPGAGAAAVERLMHRRQHDGVLAECIQVHVLEAAHEHVDDDRARDRA